jgi:hypothetical protein
MVEDLLVAGIQRAAEDEVFNALDHRGWRGMKRRSWFGGSGVTRAGAPS